MSLAPPFFPVALAVSLLLVLVSGRWGWRLLGLCVALLAAAGLGWHEVRVELQSPSAANLLLLVDLIAVVTSGAIMLLAGLQLGPLLDRQPASEARSRGGHPLAGRLIVALVLLGLAALLPAGYGSRVGWIDYGWTALVLVGGFLLIRPGHTFNSGIAVALLFAGLRLLYLAHAVAIVLVELGLLYLLGIGAVLLATMLEQVLLQRSATMPINYRARVQPTTQARKGKRNAATENHSGL